MKRKIIVWYNPNSKQYYYRNINDIFERYYVGYINQYSHQIIIIIDIYKELIQKTPLRTKVIRKIISLLHKLEKY